MSAIVWRMTGNKPPDWDNLRPGEIVHAYRNGHSLGYVMAMHPRSYGEGRCQWCMTFMGSAVWGLCPSARDARAELVACIKRHMDSLAVEFRGPSTEPVFRDVAPAKAAE